MRLLAMAAISSCLLSGAQGTAPRPKATDYPAHATLAAVAIGAEYLVRSFGADGQTFVADGYLVVEVAVYPAQGERVTLTSNDLTLRVNGKKERLFAQTAGMVAASLKYPDWEVPRYGEASASVGGTGVTLGRPGQVARFPGDPTVQQGRLPAPPRVPTGDPQATQAEVDVVPAHQLALDRALPEDASRADRSGFIYFAFRGKTKSIRTLELIYEGPLGKATLPLAGAAPAP